MSAFKEHVQNERMRTQLLASPFRHPNQIGQCAPIFTNLYSMSSYNNGFATTTTTRFIPSMKFKESKWKQGYEELQRSVEQDFALVSDSLEADQNLLKYSKMLMFTIVMAFFVAIGLVVLSSALKFQIGTWAYILVGIAALIAMVGIFCKMFQIRSIIKQTVEKAERQHPGFQFRLKPRCLCSQDLSVVQIFKK